MRKRDFINAMTKKTNGLVLLAEHEISRVAGRTVTPADLEAISPDAQRMLRALSGVDGTFSGPFRTAYALAHHQVAKDHYRFFACRPDMERLFDADVVYNPSWRPSEGTRDDEKREGCMTHPNRPERRKTRPADIHAEFDVEVGGKLEHRESFLIGIAARVFQHETDHANGKTIYSDKL